MIGRSHNGTTARCAPVLPAVAVVCFLGLMVALGCRSAPPEQQDEPEVEQPEEQPEDQPEDQPEQQDEPEAQQDDEDKAGNEQVASHVDSRIASAVSDVEAGDLDAAQAELQDLIDEPEGGFMAAYNLAVLKEREGEDEEAIDLYVQALQRQNDFTPALQNLIRLYLRAGQPSEADEIAREFMDKRPENLDHRAAHLEVWLHEGRYEDVVERAREILGDDINHVDAMLQMATANYRIGRIELAQAIVNRVLELSPERAEAYYILGQTFLAEDEMSRAIANFRQAVEHQPQFPEARNNYALLLHETGNYEDALEQLERAVELAPGYLDAWINKGNVYKAKGEFGDAEVAYRNALDIDDESSDALYNLGLLYLEAPVPDIDTIPRYEKAIEAFNDYREIVGQRQASDEPVAAYISQASSAIEDEEDRLEALREAQRQGDDSAAEELEEEGEEDFDDEESDDE